MRKHITSILIGILAASIILLVQSFFKDKSDNVVQESSLESSKNISNTVKKDVLQTSPERNIPDIQENIDYLIAERGNELTKWELENIAIYDARNEGVVNVTTETVGYTWFFEPVPRRGTSGSGILIDKKGYILTNRHVINNATKVFVTFADGTTGESKVLGTDAENDLAILRFEPKGKHFTVIPMGTSKRLRVGQKVLAIGNPFALDRTLTIGIVSGLGRPVRTDGNLVISNMIQTDTSINPGNSGGPLLDNKGYMIGVNTMIYSTSGGSNGVGFAVPVDTVKRVVPDLITYGYVRRGWIDIEPRQLFSQLVDYAHLPVSKGVLVSKVLPGGNAEAIGMKGGNEKIEYGRTIVYLGGDIIVSIDGIPVEGISDMYEALEDNVPGEKVDIEYIRGKKRIKSTIILSERPEDFRWD